MRGQNDNPAVDEDFLSIGSYAKGISNFILDCETPMSIAIQGQWGSGKTTIMNFIHNEIKNSNRGECAKVIKFNTWQFSQFEMSSSLPISFMLQMVEELGEDGEHKEKLLKKIYKICSSGVPAVLAVARLIGGLNGIPSALESENISKILNNVGTVPEENIPNIDLFKEIKDLRFQFENLVESACKGGEGRVVVFIDDLDRLNPVRAIELLECIKLFIESKHCVFILAVDFEVVLQGVAKKYHWGENGLGVSEQADKAKEYFDKFIQVPFYMPVNLYKTDKFIENKLKSVLNDSKTPAVIEKYQKVTSIAVGNNPRAINRLINTFALALSVLEVSDSARDIFPSDYYALYCLLCLQAFNLKFYDNFSSNIVFNQSFSDNIGSLSFNGGTRGQLRKLISEIENPLEFHDREIEALYFIVSSFKENAESNPGEKLRKLIYFSKSVSVSTTKKYSVSPQSAHHNLEWDRNNRIEKLNLYLQKNRRARKKVELLKHLDGRLFEAFGDENFSIAGQEGDKAWTLYSYGRRFCVVSFRGRISVGFGTRQKGRNSSDPHYSAEWSDLFDGLSQSLDMKRGSRIQKDETMVLSTSETRSNPIWISGIDTVEQIDDLVDILIDVKLQFDSMNNLA